MRYLKFIERCVVLQCTFKWKNTDADLNSFAQSLRLDLISGTLTTKLLVTLSPEDLATDELRKARQNISVEDRDSRRTDWLEENKGKIQVIIRSDGSKKIQRFQDIIDFKLLLYSGGDGTRSSKCVGLRAGGRIRR
jgi:hypothetical protein